MVSSSSGVNKNLLTLKNQNNEGMCVIRVCNQILYKTM